MPCFLWSSPLEPFILADFAVCRLVVINHCHEQDDVLDPVSSRSKSLDPEEVLGPPNTNASVIAALALAGTIMDRCYVPQTACLKPQKF